MLPDNAVRRFATYFLKQKEFAFAADLAVAGKMAAKWEKKGTSFIRPKPMQDYVEARRLLHRVLKKIGDLDGGVFYYGREKIIGARDLNPIGLYTTCLSHALRNIDEECATRGENFVVVIDQHSARKELLECAAKTMFGHQPCRQLASPPFEVESYLNQNIQAADWIATLIGRLFAYRTLPKEFSDYDYLEKIFSDRVKSLEVACKFDKRPTRAAKKSAAITQTPPGPSPFDVLRKLNLRTGR